MSKGWTDESMRHSLASYGIKTGRKSRLTIVPTYVPRGRGNNQNAGKLDLHYKIQEWGYVFPSKKDAEKYAKEHEEKNGQIVNIKSKSSLNVKGINEKLHTERQGNKWVVANDKGTKTYFKTNNYSDAEDWISTWGNKQ